MPDADLHARTLQWLADDKSDIGPWPKDLAEYARRCVERATPPADAFEDAVEAAHESHMDRLVAENEALRARLAAAEAACAEALGEDGLFSLGIRYAMRTDAAYWEEHEAIESKLRAVLAGAQGAGGTKPPAPAPGASRGEGE